MAKNRVVFEFEERFSESLNDLEARGYRFERVEICAPRPGCVETRTMYLPISAEPAEPIGKQMMIEQGYVPSTCTMDDKIAGPLIYSEISKGRSPCWGCNAPRAVCGGQPKREQLDK